MQPARQVANMRSLGPGLWVVAMLVSCTVQRPVTPDSEPSTDVQQPVATHAAPPIVDRPIPFDAERKRLTQDYLRKHTGTEYVTDDFNADVQMTPRMIVLHWTAGSSAQGAWNAFASTTLPGRPDLQRASPLNVSAHFVVDRDGTIWRLMPEDRVARHVIGMNHLSIGVENVGGAADHPLTPAQVDANVALVRDLHRRWPTITHLIGHLEYRRFEGHPYFRETDPTYRTTKPDPGAAFMVSVRAGVADLGLSGPP